MITAESLPAEFDDDGRVVALNVAVRVPVADIDMLLKRRMLHDRLARIGMDTDDRFGAVNAAVIDVLINQIEILRTLSKAVDTRKRSSDA